MADDSRAAAAPGALAPAAELRAFLTAELPAHRARWETDGEPGEPATFAERREFQRLLARGGWAAPGWPVEHGGRGLGIADRLACDAVLAECDAPLPLGVLGLANVGPALIEFGDDVQRARLPRILDGTDIWCQGFSEPGAGSDLAGLRTRAVPDGRGGFVINGQKVWTSNGMEATHCMLLARTDPAASRHRGISVLLVSMDAPGVQRRPITMISGDQEFAELFFTDVRVPAGALLGRLHGGWGVTMRTLVHERTGVLSRASALQRRAHAALLQVAAPAGPGSADSTTSASRMLSSTFASSTRQDYLRATSTGASYTRRNSTNDVCAHASSPQRSSAYPASPCSSSTDLSSTEPSSTEPSSTEPSSTGSGSTRESSTNSAPTDESSTGSGSTAGGSTAGGSPASGPVGSGRGVAADERLVRRWCETRVLGLLGERTLSRAEAGVDTSAEQAMIKLAWGLADRSLAETLLDLAGPAAAGGLAPDVVHGWLWTRASTIAAGTTEILRDLLAERVLGLPR